MSGVQDIQVMSLVFDVFEYWLQALVLSVQEWLPQPSGRPLQHSLPCCDLSTTAHCSTTALVYTTLHCTIYTTLHCTTLHNTILHNSTQHCTAQLYTTLHCTTSYNTALHKSEHYYTTVLHCSAAHKSAVRYFGSVSPLVPQPLLLPLVHLPL